MNEQERADYFGLPRGATPESINPESKQGAAYADMLAARERPERQQQQLAHYRLAEIYATGNGTSDDELSTTPDVVLQHWAQLAQVHASLAVADEIAALRRQQQRQQQQR